MSRDESVAADDAESTDRQANAESTDRRADAESDDRRDGEPSVPDGYVLREGTPPIEDFRRIRRRAGMTDRPPAALERGLSNTTYGAYVERIGGETENGATAPKPVAMGRIVGDGATAFLIVDVAVVESHQGNGLGTAVVDALVTHVRDREPAGGFVYLFADVDDFYDRWGFERSAPASKGMWIRADDL